MLKTHTRVRLLTDKYQTQGAARDDIGYIIETYPDGNYEVEFSDADGVTKAQIVARQENLQLAEGVSEAPQRELPVNTFQEHIK